MTAHAYAGGSQCGAVRFEAVADLARTVRCNCSRCGRLGSILSFAPASAFTWLGGGKMPTGYRFIAHRIAPDSTETVAVNVRAFDDVDAKALTPPPFDGRSP